MSNTSNFPPTFWEPRKLVKSNWAALFDLVPNIYCISFITDKERREKIMNMFHQLGIESKIKFVYGKPDGGFKCSCKVIHQHLAIYTEALKLNYTCVCVFEDDAALCRELTTNDVDAFISLSKKQGWSALQLGYDDRFYNLREKYKDDIYHVNTLYSHSYIISKQGMTRFVENWRPPIHPIHIGSIDTFFLVDPDVYAFKTRLFRQADNPIKMRERMPVFTHIAWFANYIYWNKLEIVLFFAIVIVVLLYKSLKNPNT